MTGAYETCAAPGGLELARTAVEHSGLRPPARILDIGCGSGKTVEWLRSNGFDAVGLDRSHADVRANVPIVQARAEDLPFGAGTLDGIWAACSLSLATSQDAVLDECARVLVRGGKLLITDVYARSPEAIGEVRALEGAGAAGMIVREELESGLTARAFRVLRWEDHSSTLRAFVAQYIFEHGPEDDLWPCGMGQAIRCVRPGYFLLVAEAGKGDGNGR